MNDKSYHELRTERLFLQRLKKSDWKMISYLRSDKEVNKFVKRPSASTKKEALEFIAKINSGMESNDFYYWKLTLINQSVMIGSICLWNFSKDKKTAEIGYDLSPQYQGKGLMNESLKKVVTFGFQNLNLDLIEAYTQKQNISSIKLLKTNGFTLVKGKKDEHNEDNTIYELKKDGS